MFEIRLCRLRMCMWCCKAKQGLMSNIKLPRPRFRTQSYSTCVSYFSIFSTFFLKRLQHQRLAKKHLVRNTWIIFPVSVLKSKPRNVFFWKLFRINESRNNFFGSLVRISESRNRSLESLIRISESRNTFFESVVWISGSNQWIKKHLCHQSFRIMNQEPIDSLFLSQSLDSNSKKHGPTVC